MLSQAAAQLAGIAMESHKGDFAAIVGVITGGAVLAEQMLPHLPPMKSFEILFRRPSTKLKDKAPGVFRVLKHLPLCVSNWLRMAESQYLYLHSRNQRSVSRPTLDAELREFVASLPDDKSLLLVDDSIDSGATLAGCIEALREINPRVDIVVATLTVTMPDPLVEPDFHLYSGRTLVRFPWSKDYRTPISSQPE
ncbi:MAG: phosphoribosyltransferase [Duncaniella sp.]|nr:phosphoribosyltransferase [Duncaniella sp.]